MQARAAGGLGYGIGGSFFNLSASDGGIITNQHLEAELKRIEREIDD